MKNKYKKIIILSICELISLSILFFNESVVKEFSNVNLYLAPYYWCNAVYQFCCCIYFR